MPAVLQSTAIRSAPWAPGDTSPLDTLRQAARSLAMSGLLGQARRAAVQGWIDEASGLHNVRGLGEAGEELLAQARAAGRPVSLVVLDFDDLLEVRSIYGREAAREALTRVVRRIRRLAGTTGIAARTDRTQFAVLLPGLSQERARQLVQRTLGQPARVEFDFAGDEIVIVPDVLCEAAAPAGETVLELFRSIAQTLVEHRAFEQRRRDRMQRQRERHSRPMSLPPSTF